MKRAVSGKSLFDTIILVFLALVLVASGYTIVRSAVQSKAQEPIVYPNVHPDKGDIDLTGSPVYNGWFNNARGYQQVMKVQETSNKPLLVYFYAPWCPHCKNLHRLLLSQPGVIAAMKGYDKVRIYPDEDEADRNLMSQFGAHGFPSMYIRPAGDKHFREVNFHTDAGEYLDSQTFINELKKDAQP